MNVKDTEEILDKVTTLAKKYLIIAAAIPQANGVLNEAQQIRLNEQLDSVLAITDRIIKNFILLEQQNNESRAI